MVIELATIKHSVWVALILAVGVELYVKGLMGEAESNKVRAAAHPCVFSHVFNPLKLP